MSSKVRLGGFILAALVAFGVMVFLLGDKQFLFSSTYDINTQFENVAGLDPGAPVRAGGVHVGTVQRIKLPRPPDDRITVEMKLEKSTRDVIKKDSIATIETEGLLGAKYIAITFGSPEAATLRSGDTIDSRPPLDYADIARKTSQMLDSAKEAIDSSKTGINNIDEASNSLKSITGKIDSGQGTLGGLVNDRALYQNLNTTVAQAKEGVTSFQEDMEALKHTFLLRGFFNKRGYFDSSELTKHAIARLPRDKPVKEFTFDAKDLFAKPDTAKLSKTKVLNEAGAFLQSGNFGLAVIQAEPGPTGEKATELSEARAMVVRQYLADKFKVDVTRVKTMGLSKGEGSGRITILVYGGGGARSTVEARNK